MAKMRAVSKPSRNPERRTATDKPRRPEARDTRQAPETPAKGAKARPLVAHNQLNIEARPARLADLDNYTAQQKEDFRTLANRSRAIVLVGPTGNGKTTLAEALANEILTNERGEVDTHSLIEQNCGAKTGVDDIRALLEHMDRPTVFGSRRKVVILDEVHKLSAQALSALLTPLEKSKRGEPPKGALVIACTNMPQQLTQAFFDRFITVKVSSWDEASLRRFADKQAKRYGRPLLSDAQLRGMVNPRQVLTALDGSQTVDAVEDVKGAFALLCALLVGNHTINRNARYDQVTTQTLMAMGRYLRGFLGTQMWSDGDVKEQVTSLNKGYTSGMFDSHDVARVQYAIGMALTAACAGNVPQIMLLDVLLAHAIDSRVAKAFAPKLPSRK